MSAPKAGGLLENVIGWDVGGAHLKAAWHAHGRLQDVAQWACPLWKGMDHLHAAVAAAQARWPEAMAGHHAVTMTGEMTDGFADRAEGVARIATALTTALPGPVRLFAPAGAQRAWVGADEAARAWTHIASANWLASAHHAGLVHGAGLLVDVGSTTTDLIRLRDGGADTTSQTDRDRLASGELVYQGVVRTPLCALAQRVPLAGQALNVMNEWFATTADVYRLTGELDAAHDLHPAADGGGKDLPATRRRLAHMVGCDAADASAAQWLALAQHWRGAQAGLMATALRRVWRPGAPPARVVTAGCGAFLVPEVLRLAFGTRAAGIAVYPYADATMASVCAPSVAVAALYLQDQGRLPCGL
ncbi:MAG: H4MPT-linked C1 transfer pathway protein [Proteobacteria bacterium]|nr:H4MPT-linked C1 transfer pathway protein [Pseudomonadota bacterium]